MSKGAIAVWVNIIVVIIVSVIWAYFRSEAMAQPEVLAKRGLAVIKRENLLFFGLVLPVFVGLVSHWIYGRWYGGNPFGFLLLAVSAGSALSILAAIFYRNALMDFSFLHIVHIIAFGYVMPLMLKAA